MPPERSRRLRITIFYVILMKIKLIKGDSRSPTIVFEQGLTTRTGGNAVAETQNAKQFNIDADYAASIEKTLADPNVSPEDKQAAILRFYQTVLDETTHTGDFKKNGRSSGGEVGGDAVNELYYTKRVKTDEGQWIDVQDPAASMKDIIKSKQAEGKSDVLPTVPSKDKE